ncbi:MAG: FHA domain-containing protein, partial [Acidobacteriia bacterium]|nr:FHA domain-containing protein [Terriglobia bacterium]
MCGQRPWWIESRPPQPPFVYTRWLAQEFQQHAGNDAGARLEALSGPLQGNAYPLRGMEISIGRDPQNDIPILDSLVSRRHCIIRPNDDGFRIVDLDSRNCTFVNGVPAKERDLAHGDEIRLGSSIFVYHGPESASEALRMRFADTPSGSTIVLRKEDAVYLRSGQSTAPLPATGRTVHDLDVLLQFSMALNSIASMDELGHRVLEAVAEAVPAERAALLLVEDGSEEFSRIFSWDRQSGFDQPIEASQTMLRQALEEGTAVLSKDPVDDDGPAGAARMGKGRIRSLLACPLEVHNQRLGVLYLEGSSSGGVFDSAHLQLVTALANVAALALRHVRRIESLETENRRLQQELNIEHNMVGESQAVREVYQFIARVAGTDSTVLIWGESGTGKELVARAIHTNSSRAGRP